MSVNLVFKIANTYRCASDLKTERKVVIKQIIVKMDRNDETDFVKRQVKQYVFMRKLLSATRELHLLKVFKHPNASSSLKEKF